jgi:diguanylate cyclase (GGDEF)-like protein
VFRSPRLTYPLAGIVLGAGAPIGAFLLRWISNATVRAAPLAELSNNRFFYLYELIGSCIVFALAGWGAGVRADRLERAESFYHALSEHDPLTGLYNERAFRDRYSRSLERAIRIGQPLSLLLIDVDGLKKINDQYGHRAGNKALIHVAKALREAKRREDSASRWGGDEFAILLEGADENATRRVAESVLARVRQKPVPFTRGHLTVSVSAGACTAAVVTPATDLFARADEALYAAKRAGRNQVHFAPSS